MALTPVGREGFALVLVILALTLLTAVASAALVAAVGQLRAATAKGRLLSARAGAEGAVDALLATTRGWPASQVGDSAVEMWRAPFARAGRRRVVDLRLTRETHLFVGEAALDSGIPVRTARLVWWMDPVARVAAHGAVVEAGTIDMELGARVSGDAILRGRPGVPGCHGLPDLAAALGGTVLQAASDPPPPPEWGAGSDGPAFAGVRLGWFGWSVLQRLADHSVAAGTPLPSVGCTGCWSGLVFGEGSTEFAGRGAGVLVVHGDLALASGSSWTGLILVSGDVTVRGMAGIQGLVRAGGSVTLESGSLVDGSVCTAYRALLAAGSLARPIPMPGRSLLAPLAPAPR